MTDFRFRGQMPENRWVGGRCVLSYAVEFAVDDMELVGGVGGRVGFNAMLGI
jgi:hypothetical protein